MSVEIYQLTPRGQSLAHNIYAPPNNPRWKVIQFLNQRGGTATKEQILNYVPSASWQTLAFLRRKEIVQLVGKMAEV